GGHHRHGAVVLPAHLLRSLLPPALQRTGQIGREYRRTSRLQLCALALAESGSGSRGPSRRSRRAALSHWRCYFFFGAAFLVGAAAQGVDFKFSIFAFSVSIVSRNGSFVNAEGTPSH